MKCKSENKNQAGFSYIDLMISMLIFLIGILAMVGTLSANRMRAQIIEKQLVAKQVALSSMESILAAKELKPSLTDEYSGWDTIGIVGTNTVNGVNRGIFESDYRPIRQGNGADGIIGTADDACTVTTAACGSNNSPVVVGFDRKIEIDDIADANYSSIRQRNITVTIRYQVNGRNMEEVLKTIMTDYR
jgi:Tfp pilus assembly protein PilV